jgi:hypothetical protein
MYAEGHVSCILYCFSLLHERRGHFRGLIGVSLGLCMQVKLPWDTGMSVALARVLTCMTQLCDAVSVEALLAKVGWHESCMHVMPALSLYTRHLPLYNLRLCLIWQMLCAMAVKHVLISSR